MLVASGVLALGLALGSVSPGLQVGDIVFHTSRSQQSAAIQLATHSKYSHMGIVVRIKGKLSVLEAVEPVRLTAINDWIARGVDKHVVAKRLVDANRVWSEQAIEQLERLATKEIGKHYDAQFGWGNDRMYCSELVYKIVKAATGKEVGHTARLRDFDLTHPKVKGKLRERYGASIPLDEDVISPEAIFTSPELVTVLDQ